MPLLYFLENAFEPLDQEEKDLMELIERDEWQPVKNIDQEKERAIVAARNTLKKEKRINLRLTPKDFHQIQIKANEEGIPYQTLIPSLVHKYLKGSLAPRSWEGNRTYHFIRQQGRGGCGKSGEVRVALTAAEFGVRRSEIL